VRGEVRRDGERGKAVPNENSFSKPTASEVGLSRKDIHEARTIRDAHVAEPGIVSPTTAAAIAAGQEPTRSRVRAAVTAVARTTAQPIRGTSLDKGAELALTAMPADVRAPIIQRAAASEEISAIRTAAQQEPKPGPAPMPR
jgi:hypothetical protein